MANPPLQTRIVLLTAARTFVGQHTIEIPDFCWNERFRGLVAGGGATTRFLSEHMRFGRVQGTGLASPLVSNLRGTVEAADFALGDIAPFLREDGFIF